MAEHPTELLTYREALFALSEFVWRFAQQAGDDLLTLVGDTEIDEAGKPFDAAVWQDWVDCVEFIRAGNRPRSTG